MSIGGGAGFVNPPRRASSLDSGGHGVRCGPDADARYGPAPASERRRAQRTWCPRSGRRNCFTILTLPVASTRHCRRRGRQRDCQCTPNNGAAGTPIVQPHAFLRRMRSCKATGKSRAYVARGQPLLARLRRRGSFFSRWTLPPSCRVRGTSPRRSSLDIWWWCSPGSQGGPCATFFPAGANGNRLVG